MKEEKRMCKECGFYVPMPKQGFCSVSRVRVFEDQDCQSFNRNKPIVINLDKPAMAIMTGIIIILVVLIGR